MPNTYIIFSLTNKLKTMRGSRESILLNVYVVYIFLTQKMICYSDRVRYNNLCLYGSIFFQYLYTIWYTVPALHATAQLVPIARITVL